MGFHLWKPQKGLTLLEAQDDPDLIIGARKGSPLILGVERLVDLSGESYLVVLDMSDICGKTQLMASWGPPIFFESSQVPRYDRIILKQFYIVL